MIINLIVKEGTPRGTRLDKYLVSVSSEIEKKTGFPFTRSSIKKTVSTLRLNGKTVKLSSQVFPGDKISFIFTSYSFTIKAEKIPLSILYEDKNILVLNKAAGISVHPSFNCTAGTLVNALIFHNNWKDIKLTPDINYNKMQEVDRESYFSKLFNLARPGIVHRLDKETSGVMITAKNTKTQDYLIEEFKCRLPKKTYICIAKNIIPPSISYIDTNIVRDPRNRKRFITTDKDEGKRAKTKITVLHYYRIRVQGKTYSYTLLKVSLLTGRTHQIRCHLKSIGGAILGDPLYGGEDKVFSGVSLMLHSWRLTLPIILEDGKTEERTFIAPCPERIKEVIRKLNKLEESS